MISRIFGVALGAGCAAGLALALLQAIFTTPIILQAEVYETASAGMPAIERAVATAQDMRVWLVHGHESAAGDGLFGLLPDGWAPEDGFERTAYTTVTSVLVGFGFALLLLSAMLASGAAVDARSGLLWGLGGFAAVALAPALGLPPELPGSAAAELADRQLWWVGTALATALGLWLIASRPQLVLKAAGLVLLLAPHVIGAPHPHEYVSRAPAELAGHFVATSLVCAAVFWALLGLAAGWLWQRSTAT